MGVASYLGFIGPNYTAECTSSSTSSSSASTTDSEDSKDYWERYPNADAYIATAVVSVFWWIVGMTVYFVWIRPIIESGSGTNVKYARSEDDFTRSARVQLRSSTDA
jgi:hypothetical protein